MGNNRDNNKKVKVIRFNISWIYILLIAGIGFLLFRNSSPEPAKVEWSQIKSMALDGDVKQINFVRNNYDGSVSVRPESVAKYLNLFPEKQVPSSSPQFTFMVSDKFDIEKEVEAVNDSLAVSRPDSAKVKLVIENDSKMWKNVLDWLI